MGKFSKALYFPGEPGTTGYSLPALPGTPEVLCDTVEEIPTAPFFLQDP